MIADHIKIALQLPTMIVHRYLEDLTDDDLLVRPLDTMNHIAWQLGHLIAGEHFHITQVMPDSMPPLPDHFAEKHGRETAARNDRAAFYPKSEYLRLMEEQRAGTLAALVSLSDDELMQPSPESINYFGPTVGAVFAGESAHWMMHAGQWAVVRRKLGKPPLF